MRISANTVTFVRIVLLPIPCYLVYGGMISQIAGLALFVILGLADFLDGFLARRNGVTVLGSLMDPIGDKIFLAATFLPLGDMRIIPLWVVFIIMAREFAVTSLRSVFLEQKITFQTSELAKIKTNVQMGGAGFIFLIHIFSHTIIDRIVLGILAGMALAMLITYHVIMRRKGLRAISAFILLGGTFVVRLLLPPDIAITVIYVVVLAFALISGFSYAHKGWRELPHKIPLFSLRYITLFVYSPIIFPALFIAAVLYVKATLWAIILLFALEFASSGLDNHVTYLGKRLDSGLEYAKVLVQTVCGVITLVAGIYGLAHGAGIMVSALVTSAVLTTVYTVFLFYQYRSTF